MGTKSLVRLENVRKNYKEFEALKDVSLNVDEKEVVCVIGPSGSGKSTMLRCINHLEKIEGGVIWVNGERLGYEERNGRLHELPERRVSVQRRATGMVFQDFNLFAHKTVLENVIEAPVHVRKLSKADAIKQAGEILQNVRLGDKLSNYPSELSGGQQQRVAIARALAMEPKVMLFDEPTSALDPELVGEVLTVMRALADNGMTMIVVTHELGFARSAADRIVYMEAGEIVEEGAVEQMLDAPQSAQLQRFLQNVIH